MNWLTRQEQFVLATVLTLLLVGLAVKTYRTAHPVAHRTEAGPEGETNAPATPD